MKIASGRIISGGERNSYLSVLGKYLSRGLCWCSVFEGWSGVGVLDGASGHISVLSSFSFSFNAVDNLWTFSEKIKDFIQPPLKSICRQFYPHLLSSQSSISRQFVLKHWICVAMYLRAFGWGPSTLLLFGGNLIFQIFAGVLSLPFQGSYHFWR